MEITSTRQLLRNLCTDSPWSYAIFWKLQQRSPMVLSFEDGYLDDLKMQPSCSSMTVDGYPWQDFLNFVCGKKVLAREFNGYYVGFELDNMRCHQYKLGEGLVGRVALSGDALWIYSDDIASSELFSNLECIDEWLLSMKAGIKTTLLVPILSHGVLQVGSLEKVAKNVRMISDIKDKSIALATTLCATSFASNANDSLFSSILIPELDKDDSSFSCCNLHKVMDSEYSPESYNAKIGNETMLPFTNGTCSQPHDAIMIPQFTVDQDLPDLYSDLNILENTLNQFVFGAKTIEDIWNSCHEEKYLDAGIPGVSSSVIDSYLTSEVMEAPVDENGDETGCSNVGDFGGFVSDYELLEVLGAAFQTESDRPSGSSNEENLYFVGGVCPLETEPPVWLGERDDQEHLLEAMVTSLCNNSDETLSYWCNSSRSSVTSFAEIAPSFQVQLAYEGMAAPTQDSNNISTFSGWPSTSAIALSSYSSFDSLTSGVTEADNQPMTFPLANGSDEVPKIRGKRRSKSSHRPRPRDRQLIQERLRELRELVPKGEKSSIDGLLDQTIQHMLFLKSVTEQAEKVKQFRDQELTVDENRKTSSVHRSSTGCAMDVGDNLGSCPIIVKDLDRPGDILIQMLCNNEEVFFEMAQVMHQLKLTILRGVMETQSEKWAHFIVQASSDFNRLDIFWPLMRILQRNGNWNVNQWCPTI